MPCLRNTYQAKSAIGMPSNDVPMKKSTKPTCLITKPEVPASKLPGSAHSEVSSANWLAAMSFDTMIDINVISTICAKAYAKPSMPTRAAPPKRGLPMTKLDMLNAQRAKKFTALCALVARDLGYGELPDLSEADRNH